MTFEEAQIIIYGCVLPPGAHPNFHPDAVLVRWHEQVPYIATLSDRGVAEWLVLEHWKGATPEGRAWRGN